LCNLDELPWAAQLRRPADDFDGELPTSLADAGAGLTADVDAA
jgi:hypothetical protein